MPAGPKLPSKYANLAIADPKSLHADNIPYSAQQTIKAKIDSLPSGGGMTWSIIAANTQAVKNNGYALNASGNLDLTLPATPTAGDVVGVSDVAGTASMYTVRVLRNGSNINRVAEDLTIDIDNWGGTFVYIDATIGWQIVDSAGFNGAVKILEPMINDLGTRSGTITLDYAVSRYHKVTVNNDYTIAFSNLPVGRVADMLVEITNGGNFVATWSNVDKWKESAVPTLQSSGTDILLFMSLGDGTIYGAHTWDNIGAVV